MLSVTEEYRSAQTRLARLQKVRLLLSGLLAVIFVGFLTRFYFSGARMYAPEKFQPILKAEAERLTPVVLPAVEEVIRSAGPVLAKELEAKLQEARPQLAHDLEQQITEFTKSVSESTEQEVRLSLERMSRKATERLRKDFPRLSKESELRLFKEKWERTLSRDTEDLTLYLHNTYAKDLDALQVTIHGFRGSRFEQFDREKLQLYYLHLWLAFMNQQLMKELEGLKS